MFSRDRGNNSLAGAYALAPDDHATTHQNSKIMALVEEEFSRMEAEHARIRMEALATHHNGEGQVADG